MKHNISNNKNIIKAKVAEEEKLNIKHLKKILPKLKRLKDYESKSLYLMIIVQGFIFYTLAYVFFYGYYFGGKSNNIQSVLQVVINPVPFNFKFLTILGSFLVLIVLVVVNISGKISQSLNKKSKMAFLDIIFLIILFILKYGYFQYT